MLLYLIDDARPNKNQICNVHLVLYSEYKLGILHFCIVFTLHFIELLNYIITFTCTKIYTQQTLVKITIQTFISTPIDIRIYYVYYSIQEFLVAFSKQILCSLPEFYCTPINPPKTRHFLINLSRPDIVFALTPSFRFRGNHYERKKGLYRSAYLTREVQPSNARYFLINPSRPDIVFALTPSFRFRGNHYERKKGLYRSAYLTREEQPSNDTIFPN